MLAVRITRRKRRPPPPWWGRAVPLSELASLEKRGEGVTLAACSPPVVVLSARVTPSPSFSKLATLAKRKSPPPPRGRGSVPSWLRLLGPDASRVGGTA